MRILALTKYGSLAASTRQRFLQYVPYLREFGLEVQHSPLLGNDYVRHLGSATSKISIFLLREYLERMRLVVSASKYDLLWIQYELFPYLPAMFERLGLLPQRPLVFDFDDAIFNMYDNASNALVRSILRGKLAPLLRRADLCCCGNSYLMKYTQRFCSNTMVLPTVVDTKCYKPKKRTSSSLPVIGWIGSSSTAVYLKPLLPLLSHLAASGIARVKIVGAGNCISASVPNFEILEWSQKREIADVQSMDIGIMPLPDDEWARGKCGFKLIQYMACGIPVIASPVGMNNEIVGDGTSGYLAKSIDEWRIAVTRLIAQPEERLRLGKSGRARVVRDYSTRTHAPRLVAALKSVADGKPQARA